MKADGWDFHQLFTRLSDGLLMHRCYYCFKSTYEDAVRQGFSVSEAAVTDNGFVPVGTHYPHRADCPVKDVF